MIYFKIYILNLFVSIFITNLYGQTGQTTLSIPENNSAYLDTESIYFEWNTADSAEFYEIYIDNDEDFSTPIYEEIIYGLSSEVTGIYNNRNFHWKVRAGRENGSGVQEFGPWSDSFTFTTEFLAANNFIPLDGSIDEEFFNLRMEWELNLHSAMEGVNSLFLVQVSKDSSFNNTVFEKNVINSNYVIASDLEPGNRHYWRVKYSNNFGESSWSEITSFQTKHAELEQVVLQYPEDNHKGLFPLDVNFEWQIISDVESYNFELSTDSTFTSIIESNSSAGNGYSTNIPIYNKKLYWRVQAEEGIKKSQWSAVWSFTTSQAPPQTPPNLISPQDSLNTLLADSLQFKWIGVYSADTYYLEISNEDHFNNLIFSQSAPDTGIIVNHIFEESKTYYWRVKSENDQGEGPWSEPRIFSFSKVTNMDKSGLVNNSFQLLGNYPNPFNPSTTIEFKVAEKSLIILNIYNMLGQKVKTLRNETTDPGLYKSRWDGTNNFGKQTTSGIFYYRLEVTGLISNKHSSETKRMIKIK